MKFKVCEFNKKFLSCAQVKANFIRLEKSDVLKAKKDLENNISYLEFKSKYPKATFVENLVVLKSHYANHEDIESVRFSSLELGKSQSERIDLKQKEIESYKNNFKGK